MASPLTPQQRGSSPDVSAWASAHAGTGKTKILTDRALRLLLEGVEPSRILCLTYTNAAAGEMQQRIQKSLLQWSRMPPEKLAESLLTISGVTPSQEALTNASRLFDKLSEDAVGLRIQTIHAFCQSVLARFPLEARVPPNFTLIDDRTAEELLAEAKARLFARLEAMSHLQSAIHYLAASLSEKNLHEIIKTIIADRRHWQRMLAQPGGAVRLNTELYEYLGFDSYQQTGDALGHFHYNSDVLEAMRNACQLLVGSKSKTDSETAALWQVVAESEASATSLEVYLQAMTKADGEPKERWLAPSTLKEHPAIAELVERENERIRQYQEHQRRQRTAERTDHIIALAEAMLELYADMKRLRGVLDFDDLILQTRQLLLQQDMTPWVLYKLDQGLHHLLIDEAQDTSAEQWEITNALLQEFFAGAGDEASRSLFVVGDRKQSIYSFQGAAPELFDAFRSIYSDIVHTAQRPWEDVLLNTSYRSAPEVLQLVDAVFNQPEAKAGISSEAEILEHLCHRSDAPGRVEIWPLLQPPEVETPESWAILPDYVPLQTAEEQCAQAIAARIQQMLQESWQLPAEGRAVEPRDIMILCRKRGKFMEPVVSALKQRGIAVSGMDRMVLSEHLVSQDLIAYARFLLLPEDDLNLACLLKSPLFNVSEEQLFTLCYQREGSLWARLQEVSETDDSLTKAVSQLQAALTQSDYLRPYETFTHLLVALRGRRAFRARMGQEVDEIIEEFLEQCLTYETNHTPSLEGFVHWFTSAKQQIKRESARAGNVVQVMTVHGSKGLQAPVVFVADGTYQHSPHQSLFYGRHNLIDLPLYSPRKEEDESHCADLREQQKQREEEEARRLLYVALTRPRDYLVLAGWEGKKSSQQTRWHELVTKAMQTVPGVKSQEVPFSAEPALVLGKEWTAATSKTAEAEPITAMPAYFTTLPERELRSEGSKRPSQRSGGYSSGAMAANARARGTLVHRMLEFLPHASEPKQAAMEYLHQYGGMIPTSEHEPLAAKLAVILQDEQFASVFSSEALTEVSVSGEITGEGGARYKLHGQIDRLVLLPGKLLVVDFKTGPMPTSETEVPVGYIHQLRDYTKLLAAIYPQRQIESALLWVDEPKLMDVTHSVSGSILDSQRVSA